VSAAWAAVFSEKYRSLVNGIQRADSIVMDLHKMLMAPNIATAVLYKNGSDSYKTFSQDAHYLFSPESDASYDFGLRTYECTKPATGMRVYGVLKLYGEDFLCVYFRNDFIVSEIFS
jgi:L-2,4-diaminobutyrate decarboxylase